jgi:predicted transcriptional regulator
MEPFSFSLESETKQELRNLAAREHRSDASVVRQALREFLDRRQGKAA